MESKREGLNWIYSSEKEEWRLYKGNRYYATVYPNGVWFTWDENGTGGENWKEDNVEAAKKEAIKACKRQGNIVELEDKTLNSSEDCPCC